MKSLSDSWADYVAAVYPESVHPSVLVEARKAFFAGGMTLFRLCADAKSANERMKLYEEAKAVCTEEIKVQRTNVAPMIDPYAPCPCGKKMGDGIQAKRYKFCCGKKS